MHWVSNYDSTIYDYDSMSWEPEVIMDVGVYFDRMSSQSSYENSLLLYTDTDGGISRTKFFEEGENCNIPALIGNPNCAGS